MIIIYNFVQHLRNEFPALDFYANIRENTALQVTLPDRCILVQDSGGPSQPWTKYSTAHFQVLNRDFSSPVAAKDAKNIFDELHVRFGLILPAALNVNGVNYPAVQVSEIAAIQLPYCIGQDDAGRTSFTTNYRVIYEES